jgi:hypothetical protein
MELDKEVLFQGEATERSYVDLAVMQLPSNVIITENTDPEREEEGPRLYASVNKSDRRWVDISARSPFHIVRVELPETATLRAAHYNMDTKFTGLYFSLDNRDYRIVSEPEV